MEAVHAKGAGAGYFRQQAGGGHFHVVHKGAVPVVVAVVLVGAGGQVLDQGPSRGHVDDLGPPANPEDRQPGGSGPCHQGQFPGVAGRVDAVRLGCRLLPVPRRGDVAPAGQQQAVQFGQDFS